MVGEFGVQRYGSEVIPKEGRWKEGVTLDDKARYQGGQAGGQASLTTTDTEE